MGHGTPNPSIIGVLNLTVDGGGPVATSIEGARREVQQAFERVLQCADRAERRPLAAFEMEAWTLLLALGRALMALFLARQVARPRTTRYAVDGIEYMLKGERTSDIGTRFGKVSFTRPIGRRLRARRAKADLPIDRELGLCSGFSLGVVTGIARLCAQMAFASARENWREVYGWAPAPLAVLRMVDAVGDQARPFIEQAAPPEDDGEVLVIQVDGKGAPMIGSAEYERRSGERERPESEETNRQRRRLRRRENPRPRRTAGKKSKNAKVAVVGVIYTLRRTAHGLEGPINKRLCATFESHAALFEWLAREAVKRGYGEKRTIFLADGSDHIWRQQARYFPLAEVCLDWYHVAERIWEAGQCFHEQGSAELKQWVDQRLEALRHGNIDDMLATLRTQYASIPKTGPGNKGRRERLAKNIAFLGKHHTRLRYAEMRAEDLVIGSGAVEGAVRNLVGMRLDGPGMRWGRQRSERVLHLRCILLNRQWSALCAHLAELERFVLPSEPARAETHDAKAAA